MYAEMQANSSNKVTGIPNFKNLLGAPSNATVTETMDRLTKENAIATATTARVSTSIDIEYLYAK